MAQENLAAPPAILHRDAAGRPVVLVERWLVLLPCGHTTRRTPESIAARAQYVCGRCMGLYGQWVEGRLDPEWVREESPVEADAPEPPAAEPPRPPAPTASQRIQGERWERDGEKALDLIHAMWDAAGRPPHLSEFRRTARAQGLPLEKMVLRRMGCETWRGLMNRMAESRIDRQEAA